VSSTEAGDEIEPVGVLDAELWRGSTRLGTIARLRDLLPGRYAIGLTGRGPDGHVLPPGRYSIRLVARAVDAGDGAAGTAVRARFTILPADTTKESG
jgi:hypothetical protein